MIIQRFILTDLNNAFVRAARDDEGQNPGDHSPQYCEEQHGDQRRPHPVWKKTRPQW